MTAAIPLLRWKTAEVEGKQEVVGGWRAPETGLKMIILRSTMEMRGRGEQERLRWRTSGAGGEREAGGEICDREKRRGQMGEEGGRRGKVHVTGREGWKRGRRRTIRGV